MSIVGSKPSVDESIVKFQARTVLGNLSVEISDSRKLKSPETLKKIKQAKMIRLWLKALDVIYLSREQRDKIKYALIDIAGINDFPLAPLLELRTRPDILTGIQGPPGPAGAGGGGSGTNVSNLDVDIGTEDVDTFAVSLADGAVWHYTITNGTAYRSGIFIATWSASTADSQETSTPDVGAPTDDLVLSVDISAGNVRLRATAASNNWQVLATRYFIHG